MDSHPASGGYKYRGLVHREGGWAWDYKPYPVKKKIVEKLPRNSAGFCGGGQGLSWAVEPRKEEEEEEEEDDDDDDDDDDSVTVVTRPAVKRNVLCKVDSTAASPVAGQRTVTNCNQQHLPF
jgi:hypothetical protein